MVSEAPKASGEPPAPASGRPPVKEERAETKEDVEGKETDVAEQLLPKIDVAAAVPEEDLVAKQAPPPVQRSLPPMKSIGIEVSNGNGINQMARKVGDYLTEMGMKVARLTNANKFNQEFTKIFYLNGYETEAAYVAEQLPSGKGNLEAVKRFDRPDIRVKVFIGKDLAPYKEVFRQERKQVVATSALTKERP